MTTTQPVLPLNVEAELTIRHIRNITSGLHATGDTFVQSQARALDDLADALERSLTQHLAKQKKRPAHLM